MGSVRSTGGGGKKCVIVKDGSGQNIRVRHYGQPGDGPAFRAGPRILIPQGYSMERRVLDFIVQG